MCWRTVRFALGAIVLVALASGCGGIEENPATRRDGGAAADRPGSPADAPSARGDGVLAADVGSAMPDLGTVDTERTDAAAPSPADVDGEAAPGEAGRSDTSADAGTGSEVRPPPPSTIIVLPDTQYYAQSYPEVFAQQTQWIVDQLRPLHIEAVLHVGDLVEVFNDPEEWTVASKAMRVLDNLLPYVLVPGNHDTDANRQTPINTYFGPASMPWITGTMVAGQIENNYALINVGAQQWLVVGLEFGPRDAVVAWADAVLKAYPNNPAILLTHAYLFADGNRYDINIVDDQGNRQAFIPQSYGYTASQGINDGEMLWQKLVLPNRNVRMVFCGHDSAAARLTSSRPDGSLVHQLLSDYQWYGGPWFGYGYLRIVQLDYVKQTIQIQTYSPYLQEYLTDDANQFSLAWNL